MDVIQEQMNKFTEQIVKESDRLIAEALQRDILKPLGLDYTVEEILEKARDEKWLEQYLEGYILEEDRIDNKPQIESTNDDISYKMVYHHPIYRFKRNEDKPQD